MVYLYSTIKMMHGPINLRLNYNVWFHKYRAIDVLLTIRLGHCSINAAAIAKTTDFCLNNTQDLQCFHSLRNLSYDRFIASSKASSPQSTIYCFQVTVSCLFLKPSNSCLRLFPRLPIPSIFPSITRFRMQFLRKM